MIVPEILRRRAERLGDQPALVVDRGEGLVVRDADSHGALSFRAWHEAAGKLASALVDAGVGPGDRVAIAFENRDADRFCVSYFAALEAGAIAVPIGTRMVTSEVEHVLRHAEPRAVIADASRTDAVAAMKLPLRVLGPDEFERATSRGATSPRIARGEEDLCDILYTSGTTGVPKGVVSTHANVVHLANAGFKAFAGTSFLHAIPMWTFAGTHAMQFMPLNAQMRSVIMHRFDPTRYLALVAAHRVTVSYTVPAMIKLVLDALESLPDAARPSTASLALLMFGSAQMPPSTLARLRTMVPSPTLLNLYGQTESGGTGCAMMIPPGSTIERPDSIGRPLPPAEVRIVRDDGGDAGAGEVGEIWIRGPGRPRAYYRDKVATADTFRDDGWVRTGDLGHMDDDGYLYLDDRRKDLVIRGGLNVFPAEIDALLESHPGVREAAVVGVPHDVLGEDLVAFVVLRSGCDVSRDALRTFLAERLADYKVPRSFVFKEALPRSAMGKVLKRVLRTETRR